MQYTAVSRLRTGVADSRFRTSMFLFYCATNEELSEISRVGYALPEQLSGGWFEDLASAEAGCTGAILVAHRSVLESARSAELEEDRRISAAAFLNARPFLPPRRVDAAGGFIVRSGPFEPEILLIFRRGRWDLPKGKRNDGESMQDCAVREVREELGISRIRLVAPLGRTVHSYAERDRFRVKTTSWYLMRTPEVRFFPQTEEDIERVEWTNYTSAIELMGYQTLADHMRLVKPLVYEHVDW